jgi:hypothetical protein
VISGIRSCVLGLLGEAAGRDRPPRTKLALAKAQWRVLVDYPNFRCLFGGSSVSLLGSSVTTIALPLTAVLLLGASPVQMGLLGAASFLPHLLLGVAGRRVG